MSTTPNHTSVQNLDQLDRQIKQAEMIRQYLQVTNIDRNSLPIRQLAMPEPETYPTSSTSKNRRKVLPDKTVALFFVALAPLSSLDFNELRRDVKLAEERVERLRQELRELQSKRDEVFLKTPPPYVPPKMNSEYSNYNSLTSTTRGILDRSTPPLVLEVNLTFNLFICSSSFYRHNNNNDQRLPMDRHLHFYHLVSILLDCHQQFQVG